MALWRCGGRRMGDSVNSRMQLIAQTPNAQRPNAKRQTPNAPKKEPDLTEKQLPNIDDVRAAAARIRGVAHRTPVMTSRTLDDRCGAQIFLKCENFQRIG